MVNVADEYGIEISNISKTQFPAAGFEIVYNTYPLGTQDYTPIIKGARDSVGRDCRGWVFSRI
jgi:hypothetical protein